MCTCDVYVLNKGVWSKRIQVHTTVNPLELLSPSHMWQKNQMTYYCPIQLAHPHPSPCLSRWPQSTPQSPQLLHWYSIYLSSTEASPSAQPLPITCAPSVSLELPPTYMSQTSSSALTLPLSISIAQAESSVSPLLIPAPKASQVAQPVPIHTNQNAQQILAYQNIQRARPTPTPPGPPQSQEPLPIPAYMPLKTVDEVFAKYSSSHCDATEQ